VATAWWRADGDSPAAAPAGLIAPSLAPAALCAEIALAMSLRESLSPDFIRRRVAELGTWFHNLDLGGVKTAPDHFLGDYPSMKWRRFAHALPADLSGRTVLDIGCNAGFYSLEMKRRGAMRVVGIDKYERYLAQARFAAEVNGLEIELRHLDVYEVGRLGERFDVVLFMGVLYHLRHPLLALDLLHDHVVDDLMVFQTLVRGSRETLTPVRDCAFDDKDDARFTDPRWPAMYFIEHAYAGDRTNWWFPNRACVEAMMRSAGFDIIDHPEDEVFLCRRRAS
jgi:tRNA (mo5U34)-methyltransferase